MIWGCMGVQKEVLRNARGRAWRNSKVGCQNKKERVLPTVGRKNLKEGFQGHIHRRTAA